MLLRQGVYETTLNQVFQSKLKKGWNKNIAQFAITFAEYLGQNPFYYYALFLL